MTKAAGIPALISSDGSRQALERIQPGAGTHDESWLQELIFAHPALLPVAQIEPGFGVPIAAAREIACGHGYIDNLYLTPSGEIILVETKLWRNVQARREVVAQALDYVAALMKLGYARFEAAVLQGLGAASASSLYAVVAEEAEALDEAAFVDAVALNLARGRMLVLVVGDGIRQEAEALAELLQSHAGAHFTFALVELATWRNPVTGQLLVLPSTLAQTVMIERGILRFAGAVPTIEAPIAVTVSTPKSLTEEMFFEELARKHPQLPAAIRTFLPLVEPLGVYPEYLASLNLKADLAFNARPTNFGYITKTGKFWTDPLSWTTPLEVAKRYNETIAQLIGGVVATTSTGTIQVTTNGVSGPLVTALLPQHAQAWAEAIRTVVKEARAAEPQGSI
jgi:hypothetical protein